MNGTHDRQVLEAVPRLHFYEGGPACRGLVPGWADIELALGKMR